MPKRKTRGQSAFGTALDQDQQTQDQVTPEQTADHIFGSSNVSSLRPLRPNDLGGFEFGKFSLTATGFERPENVDERDWRSLADAVFRLEGAIQWIIGDFLLHQSAWGSTDEIAAEFGREVTTLYDYKHVASRVQFLVRTKNLSFGHHKLVATLDEEDQRYWLGRAEEAGWSIAEFRRQMRPPSKKTSMDKFVSDVSLWRKRIRKAEGHERQQMIEMLEELLDELRSK